MNTWERKNLNVVVYMRNRACSARAPPVAAVTRMMTAKCVGINRKATTTNMMMRALHQGKRRRVDPAASSSNFISKQTFSKHGCCEQRSVRRKKLILKTLDKDTVKLKQGAGSDSAVNGSC